MGAVKLAATATLTSPAWTVVMKNNPLESIRVIKRFMGISLVLVEKSIVQALTASKICEALMRVQARTPSFNLKLRATVSA
jgi:hypothetical protein